jgi:DNA (cytosine-5)-methyltransferase 1
MIHLGDITKISGHTAPMVDCIIGGSPCQDLSVAGKREGLDGARSGLYIEQTRIVKEMRERDRHNGRTGVDIRPRYMVWENVPGAFSSNKGEDFRIVLEELAKIADEDATVPMPPKGKWTTSGCILGDGWSIAWRVLDAQFWGTSDKPLPQRRRRIALIADFGGESAPEILFVRQSESGNLKPGEPKRKETATDVRGGTEADDSVGCDLYKTDITGDVSATLGVNCGMSHGRQGVIEQTLFQPVYSVENHPNDSRVKIDEEGKVQALTSRMGTGGGNVPMVMCYSKQRRAKSSTDFETWKESDTANTLNVFDVGDVRTTEAVVYSVDQGGGKSSVDVREGLSPTLTCTHDGAPVIALDRASFNQGENAKYDFEISEKGVNSPLVAKGPSLVCYSFNPTSSRDAGDYILEGVANPLINGTCPGHKNAIAYAIGTYGSNAWQSNNPNSGIYEAEVAKSLDAMNCGNPACNQGGTAVVQAIVADHPTPKIDSQGIAFTANARDYKNPQCVALQGKSRYIVRRLTPLECERLQGFPDGWTDIGEWVDSTGKKRQTSDAARYKALGNSIALPPWKWVLKRLCACYERDATMASLFDGIGGFPYLWEQLNGKGSCLWASEIEEFPIAVTKVRFT